MKDVSAKQGFGKRARSLFSSLSLTLFLWIAGVIVVAFAAYAFVNIRSTSQQWNQAVHQSAQRFSELIQHSTHYSMLVNRKEDVHHIIKMIARGPGVVGVQIYDKNGVIIFSADETEIGQRVDLQAEACVSCHGQETPLRSVPEGSRTRVFTGRGGARVLGLINPIENAPECYSAPCHAHPPEQSVLGVLDVKMSMAETDARMATAKRQAIAAAVMMVLLAGALSVVFILRVVRRPVRQLTKGAQRVAGGDLSTEIRVDSHNEIGQLAAAFNDMTRDLRQAQEALAEWSGGLEVKLQEKTVELSRTQRQVAHMDKMASLGKMAATVAHELNNPLAGILNYAKLVSRTLEDSELGAERKRELERYLDVIQKEANRSGGIVRNLLVLAHRSGGEFAYHSLNEIVERALMVVRHHLEISGVKLETHKLEGDDGLLCDADQLQQALVALVVNAVEAMPDGGTIGVRAERVDDWVRLTVSDTGVGIAPDAMPHIFEPFFSTKTQSEVAGLGLAVVYGIVERHGGRVEVDSEPDRGTRIRITLPRRPGEERGKERMTA